MGTLVSYHKEMNSASNTRKHISPQSGLQISTQLADTLAEINALPKVHLAVDADCLYYYRFEDMNTYICE